MTEIVLTFASTITLFLVLGYIAYLYAKSQESNNKSLRLITTNDVARKEYLMTHAPKEIPYWFIPTGVKLEEPTIEDSINLEDELYEELGKEWSERYKIFVKGIKHLKYSYEREEWLFIRDVLPADLRTAKITEFFDSHTAYYQWEKYYDLQKLKQWQELYAKTIMNN